jgi:hypothetical protein
MVEKSSLAADLAMFHPTRSKPESPSSPETGDATKDTFDASKPVEIELEVSRQRAMSWTIFGIIFGALLIWKLGTVGVWVGVLLVVLGVFRAYELAQTFLHPPGTISVNDTDVVLPRGLNMGHPVKAKRSDVTAVYFLRRSVPWNRSAPVLVIELGPRAFAFPRDWFASEADQRHVVHALLRGLETKPTPEDRPHHDDDRRIMWAQLVGGVLLLGAGVGAWIMSATPISNAQYALYVTPIVAGWIFAWRGLMRW